MRIYVGNLADETTEDQLRDIFTPHGRVKDVRVARDKETGAPRGFGLVIFEDAKAQAAIAALSGCSLGGRTLRVKEAKAKPKGDGQG